MDCALGCLMTSCRAARPRLWLPTRPNSRLGTGCAFAGCERFPTVQSRLATWAAAARSDAIRQLGIIC